MLADSLDPSGKSGEAERQIRQNASQQPTANGQQPMANGQQPMANGQRPFKIYRLDGRCQHLH